MAGLSTRSVASRRRHRDRKSEDMKYVDRIISPRTPADLLLALQNPLSPVSKEMMNMLVLEANIADIITRLIEKYVLQQHKIRAKEKEAIVRQVRMMEKITHQHFIIHKQALERINTQYKQIVSLPQNEMKTKVEFWTIELKRLDNSIAKIECKLAAVEKRRDEHTVKWKNDTQVRLGEKIEFGKMKFTNKNGTIISDEAVKNVLKKLVETTPAPVDLVNRVGKSYELAKSAHEIAKAQSKTSITFMPPIPPPVPSAPTPKHFSQMQHVNLEFNFIKSLAGLEKDAEVTASDMLAMIRNKKNKCPLEQLFAVTDEIKKEEEKVFADAVTIGKELRNGLLVLDVAKEIRQKTDAVLEELKDRLSELETVKITPTKGHARS